MNILKYTRLPYNNPNNPIIETRMVKIREIKCEFVVLEYFEYRKYSVIAHRQVHIMPNEISDRTVKQQ